MGLGASTGLQLSRLFAARLLSEGAEEFSRQRASGLQRKRCSPPTFWAHGLRVRLPWDEVVSGYHPLSAAHLHFQRDFRGLGLAEQEGKEERMSEDVQV